MSAALEAKRVELERELAQITRTVRSINRPLTVEEQRELAAHSGKVRAKLASFYVEKLIDGRPEVVSRGQPVAGDDAQRGLEEARARLSLLPCASRCLAAELLHPVDGTVAVHCRIEGSSLSSKSDPQSLLTFCVGTRPDSHESCPTWRASVEADRAGRALEGAAV